MHAVKQKWLLLLLIFVLSFSGCSGTENRHSQNTTSEFNSTASQAGITIENIPDYSGEIYVILNHNVPEFTEADYTTNSFEEYSSLDSLNRCGTAFANVSQDTMPDEERGVIGHIKPSGWQTKKYGFVDGNYLYNRCHLIGYQLTGENANEENLITGTRYFNVEGMLPFENEVADYVHQTNNHVLYRVTPIYENDNLVASGVQMEAMSVEDNGEGVCFHVFVYNVQPGVEIDYTTGKSKKTDTSSKNTNNKFASAESASNTQTYILNLNSKKFHLPECSGTKTMSEENRKESNTTAKALKKAGFSPCKMCIDK